MTPARKSTPHEGLEFGVEDMSLENGGRLYGDVAGVAEDARKKSTSSSTSTPREANEQSKTHSPLKNGHPSAQSTPDDRAHEVIGGEVTVSIEPGKPPKLSRSGSQKVKTRPPPLYHGVEDALPDAQRSFEKISFCSYSNRYIGSTEHGSMDCDCVEEWDGNAKVNAACGADSDCINRATKMECFGDCGCGADCQNQRFQQRQYAPVTVFNTEKKGHGLRVDADLDADDFIYEYIGEVIGEAQFRKRMIHYDEEGIKHFYFMSLTQGEFIDATKKGNLGRFCNHSCNPNCYVDKWVVGEKLRMGIFAERKIQAGEELTFNYNVDRYGADPQPCYCGEPNCTGFIGGKTQTERATKLSHTTIEALGIDDGDGWDTAVAKKPRKKKAGEDDEEYVNNVQPKALDENGVTKVMATLMQCKEKWISVKLLDRIQRSIDEKIRNRVVKMHGYQILNSNLVLWKDDANIVLQIFDILDGFPRLTKNKIADSKIEMTVDGLKNDDDERVALKANHLLQEWAHLDMAYRIPRKKRELDSLATPEKHNHFARRDSREERNVRSRSQSSEDHKDLPKGPSAPSGPRNNFPQRQPGYFQGSRPPFRPRTFNELPSGWFTATDDGGRTYFYDVTGKTTWQRPTVATTSQPPPPPPKPTGANKALEDIINEITNAKASAPKEKPPSSTGTPSQSQGNVAHKLSTSSGKEKWRSLTQEKQMRLYENTLFPHIKYVMDKFKGKLPKDDLKRFAKEISKKLVSSDFKNGRVEDPTKISSKKEKQVKTYVKDFFDKAAQKHKEREQRRAQRKNDQSKDSEAVSNERSHAAAGPEVASDAEEDMVLSGDENDAQPNIESTTPPTPMDTTISTEGLKRKRDDGEAEFGATHGDPATTPSKYPRPGSPPPPPPPPPPPGAMNGYLNSPMSDSMGVSPNELTSEALQSVIDTNGTLHLESPGEAVKAVGFADVQTPTPPSLATESTSEPAG